MIVHKGVPAPAYDWINSDEILYSPPQTTIPWSDVHKANPQAGTF